MINNCPYPDTKAVIRGGKIVSGCESCLNLYVRPNDLAASNRRNYQQREYAKDIVQPFEKSYPKAVGLDKAREMGWDEDSLRKYS